MKRPNIVIFNPDEMRWDALGHMGVNPAAVTPFLDEFARTEAVSFSNAYCQNPVCVPSRCSFFTGLYPHVHGHRTMHHLLQEGESSLFSELKDEGYYVWMTDRNDLVAGQYRGLVESHADTIYSWSSDKRVSMPDHGKPVVEGIRGEKGSKHYYSHYQGQLSTDAEGRCYNRDDAAVDAALDAIGKGTGDKPFCAFLGLFFPHCPYGVEEPYFSLIDRKKLPRRASFGTGKARMLEELRSRMTVDQYTEEDWNELRATYLGMCAKIDDQFKRLCEGLKANGTYDDTLIVFLSDHGDFAGDYDLPEKSQNTFEDCLVRVPLLIKPPKGYPVDPGVTSSLAELVDFYATVMDYAGVESDHTHFGRSLRPVVENKKEEVRTVVFSEGGRMPGEIHCDEYHASVGPDGTVSTVSEYWPKQDAQRIDDAHCKGTMVRDKRYKYIKRANGKDEFYDTVKDPLEECNVIEDSLYKEEILRLKGEMLDWYQRTCDVVPFQYDSRMSIHVAERMAEEVPEAYRERVMDAYRRGAIAPRLRKVILDIKKEIGM